VSRIFGITAVFVGWLSLGIGAGAGLVVSEFFGLNYVDGPLPPITVYGISGAVVLWALVAAAVVTAVPMAMAMVADDPRRSLFVWAVVMAVIAVALVPDPLGRAFGLPLLGGAVCLVVGGELIYRETMATGSMTGREPTPNVSAAPSPPVTSEPGIAPADTPSPPRESPRPAIPPGERRPRTSSFCARGAPPRFRRLRVPARTAGRSWKRPPPTRFRYRA
jgi:hypothetical protein